MERAPTGMGTKPQGHQGQQPQPVLLETFYTHQTISKSGTSAMPGGRSERVTGTPGDRRMHREGDQRGRPNTSNPEAFLMVPWLFSSESEAERKAGGVSCSKGQGWQEADTEGLMPASLVLA